MSTKPPTKKPPQTIAGALERIFTRNPKPPVPANAGGAAPTSNTGFAGAEARFRKIFEEGLRALREEFEASLKRLEEERPRGLKTEGKGERGAMASVDAPVEMAPAHDTLLLKQQAAALTRERDALRQEVDRLLADRDRWKARHDEVGGQLGVLTEKLARNEAEALYGSVTGVQHDRLTQQFEHLKRNVESVTQDFLTKQGARERGGLDPASRRKFGAEFKVHLTLFLLAEHAAGSGPDTWAEHFLSSPEVAEHQNCLSRQGIQELFGEFAGVARAMAESRPRARLLRAEPGAAYDPRRHEAVTGYPDSGDLDVENTVFPGYEIESLKSVVVKADVTTVERMNTPHSSSGC